MKKSLNIKNVIALLAVLLVWGYLMKSKFGFFETQDEYNSYSEYSITPLMKQYNKDTFELKLTTKDPFLGGKNFKVKSNSNLKTNLQPSLHSKNKVTPVVSKKRWPNIAYFGYVKNRTKGKQACLVQINGSTSKMFLNSKNNEVVLNAIYKDSIKVGFNDEVKIIVKN